MENKYRVQDDLYKFVNQEWIDSAVIPDDRPTTGGFNNLDTAVEELMISLFNKMGTNEIECPNDYLVNAVKLFNLLNDTKTRNKNKAKPVLKDLKMINSLTKVSQLNKKSSMFVLNDFPLPFRLDVDVNMKDATKHCVMITGPSVILPDTTYYLETMASQKDALLKVWSDMVDKLLAFTPLSLEERAEYISDALKFDELIAKYVKSSEEWSEYTKMFNPMKVSKVASMVKPLKLKDLLTKLFTDLPEEVIVTEPRYFKAFKEIFNEDNFVLYKHWAYIKLLLSRASYLSEEIRELSSVYQRTLTGAKSISSNEKFAYKLASSMYAEPVGLYYGENYFGSEAKNDVINMVNEIIEAYKARIEKNTFLSAETKQKAIVKLSTIVVKMGYPDKCDSVYDLMKVDDAKNVYEVISDLKNVKIANSISKLYETVDRTLWPMPGHMVNACYNPTSNDITFPAAILQAPFYSIKQTKSENLGGIGAVIAHEITHAFDNNGALCDELGNLNNWWTKDDFKNFKKLTKDMVKEFDGIELEAGIVNGNFIVSENIADNGGMAVTLDIMRSLEDKSYEEYFINWGRIWCVKAKPEYAKLLLSIDVHAPAMLRANMQPRNFEEWYETFNVKKTDKMYIAPSKRVVIW